MIKKYWAIGLGMVATMAVTAEPLRLGGPELEPIRWESRQLTAVDVNGDGRTDLALIDGVERALTVFLQREEPMYVTEKSAGNSQPPTRLSRFEKTTIALENAPNSFVFGDFDGNGKLELAYTGARAGLSFLELDDSGRWRVKRVLAEVEGLPYTHCLWAGKLRAGGPVVLLGLFKGYVGVVENYDLKEKYRTLNELPVFLNLTDINYDGRSDLVYEYDNPAGIAYRLQDAAGRFDSESFVPYANQSEKVFAFEGDKWSFFGGKTAFVEKRVLTFDTQKPNVTYYGGNYESASGVLADIDGDGDAEWVVADPVGQLTVWRRVNGNWGNPQSFPTFKGVEGMAWSQKEGALAVFGKDEQLLGLAKWDDKNARMSFPKVLESQNTPLALLGDGREAWVVEKSEKEFYVRALNGQMLKLEGIKRDTESYGLWEMADGKKLLAVFAARETVNLYVLSENAAQAVKISSALQKVALNNLEASMVGFGDSDGDGIGELLVAQRDSLRIFEIKDGRIEQKDQVLEIPGGSQLRLPFLWEGKLWAFDTRRAAWVSFGRDAKGLWKMGGGKTFPVSMTPAKVMPVGGMEWMVVARKAFYVVKPQLPGETLETLERAESKLGLKGYSWGARENFGTKEKKRPLVVLYNQPERIVEFWEAGEAFEPVLNFKLYDRDEHYSGRRGEEVEPREMIAADLTGDGLPDMAVIAHDRLLVYPQQ